MFDRLLNFSKFISQVRDWPNLNHLDASFAMMVETGRSIIIMIFIHTPESAGESITESGRACAGKKRFIMIYRHKDAGVSLFSATRERRRLWLKLSIKPECFSLYRNSGEDSVQLIHVIHKKRWTTVDFRGQFFRGWPPPFEAARENNPPSGKELLIADVYICF